jgi:hypothetical protein
MIDLNKIRLGLLAGMLGGVVAGVGARIAMRVVALVTSGVGSFSLGGTLAILLFGVILGMPFGMLFVGVRRWLPGAPLWKGLIFGAALALIFVAPPFLLIEPEGELALVSPLVGLGLFAPLPLVYGVVVAVAAEWLGKKYAAAPRQSVGVAWFGLMGVALLFGFTSMLSLVESPPFPPILTRAIQQAGIPFRIARGVNTGLLVFYALGYCGLAALIFWRGSQARMAKFTALALLTFAGAFFNGGGDILGGVMRALPIARWATGAVQALGFIGLLLLFYLFPDRRFAPRWTRPVALVGCAWAVWWFLDPASGSPLDPNRWPEPILFGITAALLGAGVFAQIDRYRRAPAVERQQTKWVVIAMTGAALAFALIWLMVMLFPDLHFARREPGLASLFAFALYLLPGLLIPLSIGLAVQRHGLWGAAEI